MKAKLQLSFLSVIIIFIIVTICNVIGQNNFILKSNQYKIAVLGNRLNEMIGIEKNLVIVAAHSI